jgi:ornithine carbamoyltransferase
MASLVSIDDLTDTDLHAIVERGVSFASGEARGSEPLGGKIVGIYFRMTSTRTRTAFSAATLRLGGRIITFGPDDLQTNTGESIADTGRVLERMLDAVVCRTGRPQQELADWAALRTMSVVNAMTAEEHPTQALADITTLRHRFGGLSGLRVLYVGEGNNTAAALAKAMPRFGIELELRTPPGYGLGAEVAARSPSVERHDMDDLPRAVDVVYTTRWQTTGTSKPDPLWRRHFEPFQITERLMKECQEAVFMHDLPAHRGDEVTAEVLDGPASIVLAQAEHKMHSAMAVLEWCCR